MLIRLDLIFIIAGVALLNAIMTCFAGCLNNSCFGSIIMVLCCGRFLVYAIAIILLILEGYWAFLFYPLLMIILVTIYMRKYYRLFNIKSFNDTESTINQPLLNNSSSSSNSLTMQPPPLLQPPQPPQAQIPVRYPNPNEAFIPGPPMSVMYENNNNVIPNYSNYVV